MKKSRQIMVLMYELRKEIYEQSDETQKDSAGEPQLGAYFLWGKAQGLLAATTLVKAYADRIADILGEKHD